MKIIGTVLIAALIFGIPLFVQAQENEIEPNNNFAKGATLVTVLDDSAIVGRLPDADDVDWWAFDLDSTRMYHIIGRADHLIQPFHSELFFEDDTTLDILRGNEDNSGNGSVDGISSGRNLRVCGFVPWKGSGRYYLKISNGTPNSSAPSPGRYVISFVGGRLLEDMLMLHEPDDTSTVAVDQPSLANDGSAVYGAAYPIDDIDYWHLQGVEGDSFIIQTHLVFDVQRRCFDSWLDLADSTGLLMGIKFAAFGLFHDGTLEGNYWDDDDSGVRSILSTLRGVFPYTGSFYAVVTAFWNSGSTGYLVPRIGSIDDIMGNYDDDPPVGEYGLSYRNSETTPVIPVSVRERQSRVPIAFELKQNFPNPFNPSTEIEFKIASMGYTTLKIYNLLGQEIKTLLDGNLIAGEYRVRWNGLDDSGQLVANGMYIYRLQSRTFAVTKKMVFIH